MNNLRYLVFFLIPIQLFGNIVIKNGLSHQFDSQVGEVIQGTIEMANTGKSPQRVLFYLNELSVGCGNEIFDASDTATVGRSNTDWIDLSAEERLLAPGESFTLNYLITVPQEDLLGSYWGIIMVEEKPIIDTLSAKVGVNITSNVRYAVQIITDFGEDKTPELNFENIELVEENTNKALAVKLFNSGSIMVRPGMTLEIYNSEGELLLEEKAKTKKVYPSQCKTFYFRMNAVPVGTFQAVLVADCGGDNLFGVTVNLTVDE